MDACHSRGVAGGVSGVFVEFYGKEASPALGVFSDEGGEGFVKMAGDAFAGGAFDEVNLEEAVFGERLELGEAGVGGGKDGGVVEVFVYPVGKVV